jgi:hypothetical protein
MRAIHGLWTAALCAAPVVALGAVAACGGAGGGNPFGTGDPDASIGSSSGSGASSPGTPGSFGGDDAASCNAAGVEGCACSSPGQSVACWTGPASQRNVGMCHDGTSQCIQQGEFAQWGPCNGQQLDCGSGTGGGGSEDAGGPGTGGGGSEDAGGPGTGGGGHEPGGCGQTLCACIPGSVIDCDEDCTGNVYCSSSAQKTCLPDGTWGACHEVTTKQPTSCTSIGVGCSQSPSCGNGSGVYYGDCSKVFQCSIGPVGSSSGSATCSGSGTCVVQCNCQ